MNEALMLEKMEESYEGWKAVQDLEYMSIREVYECAFRHGIEAVKETPDANICECCNGTGCRFC